jgi:hypothetical protein
MCCDWRAGSEPGDGAAATATSFDDAPCPTGRGSGSLASRSAVLTANVTPCLGSVENATNADVVMAWSSELQELEQYASVRAGSARHPEPLVLGGHQRSRSASKNRRSQGVHRHDLGRRSSPALGSNPTSLLPRGRAERPSGAEQPAVRALLRPTRWCAGCAGARRSRGRQGRSTRSLPTSSRR